MKNIEVYYELLKEFHEICEANGLKYVLHGSSAVSIYRRGYISAQQTSIEVLMTQGDAEAFYRAASALIAEGKLENRFVEGMINNPQFLRNYLMFGASDTLDFQVRELNPVKSRNLQHYGLHLRIKYISQPGARAESKTTRRIWKAYNMQLKGSGMWYVKAPVALARGVMNTVTLGNFKNHRYNAYRKTHFIPNWDAIADYEEVFISGKKYESRLFAERQLTEARLPGRVPEGEEPVTIQVYLLAAFEEYAETLYGPKWYRHRLYHKFHVTSTEVGYEELMADPEFVRAAERVAVLREQLYTGQLNTMLPRRKIEKVKDVVLMSGEKVARTEYCEENYDQIMDFYQKKDYLSLEEILGPVLNSFRKMEKKGIAYSISDEMDKIIDEVLDHAGEGELVRSIHKLREKEYFVS